MHRNAAAALGCCGQSQAITPNKFPCKVCNMLVLTMEAAEQLQWHVVDCIMPLFQSW